MDVGKIINEVKSELNDGSIERAIDGLEWYQNKLDSDGMLGVTSPFKALDDMISGIIPGKVYTLGGYSNIGKSKVTYQFVNHFVDMGMKVIFFSLEVDSGMVLRNLMINKKRSKDIRLNRQGIIDNYSHLQIYDRVYTLKGIQDIVEKEKPEMVFIDFVQNIQTDGSSNYEKLAKIAISIQQLAIYNNCTIFQLSQLSNSAARDISQNNMNFVSLKGAGELFASSDVVMVLAKEEGNLILFVVKNKYGTNSKGIVLKPHREQGYFEALDTMNKDDF